MSLLIHFATAFVVEFDGTTDTLVVDLIKLPVLAQDALPSSRPVAAAVSGATVTVSRSVVTIVYTTPPVAGFASVTIMLDYDLS